MDDQHTALRAGMLGLAVALVAEILLDGHSLGINVAITAAVMLLAALVIRRVTRPFDPLDAWLPIGSIVFAGFVALRDDAPLVILDTVALLGLTGASVAAFAGFAVTRSALPRLFELAGLILVAIVTGAGRALRVANVRTLAAGRVTSPTRAEPILRGLILVLPLLLIFAVLFAAADPIFDSLLTRAITVDVDLGELPRRAVFVGIAAWVAAGLLWFVIEQLPEPVPQSLGAAVRAPVAASLRLGAIEAITILVALDLLFGLFVVLQVAYLFGGQDTVAASGIPYAQYARRGFFELVLVVALAGALIGVLEAWVRPRNRGYVAALLVLIALTAVVLASSFLRLRLYQEAYGWTELRFYVNAAIVFFGLGLVAAAVLVARDASRWLGHALGLAAVAVLIGANLLGPQAFITDRNLERVLNPGTVPPFGEDVLDAAYLGSFDADAAPALVAALPRLRIEDRTALEYRLRGLRDRLAADRGDPAAWNLARENARAALDNWFAQR